ncbi:MAG TPA: site-2 protease family protein [Bryobacteraceae bacterium]|nr:site-2 protease family protein [Bryobacteraceae bacterium]
MPDRFCSQCGAELSPGALICSTCQRLVHKDELTRLATLARQAESGGKIDEARALWEQALALLPEATTQAATIRSHLASLSTPKLEAPADEHPRWWRALGPFGVVFAVLWKFKAAILLLLSKFKLLLFGLGKAKTVFSMLATLGVYWNWYGWKFALAFIIGIYVHEMGHVWELRRYGLRASVPLFIPGLGAFVSVYDAPKDAVQNAMIGLAGPFWGLSFAIACALAGVSFESSLLMATAQATATINLFNLIPIWQLDGGRGLEPLNQMERWSLAGLCVAMWALAREGMFFLILLGLGYRLLFRKDASPAGNRGVLIRFAVLLVMLGFLTTLPVARP